MHSFSSRIRGWSKNNIEILHKLLWKHAILVENLYGIECCSPNLVNFLHMSDDIIKHSSPDNYWCFMFE